MRAAIALILALGATPALAEECRYFSATGSESISPLDEDEQIIMHTARGDTACDIASATEDAFWVQCPDSNGATEVFAFSPEGAVHRSATFRGKRWTWECFQPT